MSSHDYQIKTADLLSQLSAIEETYTQAVRNEYSLHIGFHMSFQLGHISPIMGGWRGTLISSIMG